MPSDPLPLSPELDVAWESLKRRLIIDCPDEYPQACLAVMEHRPGIEQEARTLARTQLRDELTRALDLIVTSPIQDCPYKDGYLDAIEAVRDELTRAIFARESGAPS